jgi:hypothetical protein
MRLTLPLRLNPGYFEYFSASKKASEIFRGLSRLSEGGEIWQGP